MPLHRLENNNGSRRLVPRQLIITLQALLSTWTHTPKAKDSISFTTLSVALYSMPH